MKKSLMIVVAIVAVVAGGAFVVTRSGDTPTNDSSQTIQSSNQTFSPVNTMQQSFVATITTTGGQQNLTTNVEHDGNGNWHYTASVGGQTSEVVSTADAYYTKQGDTWYKSASSQGFSKDAYEVTPDELASFQSAVSYKGTESCSAGQCHVWEATNYQGNDKLTFYVDVASNRIVRMVSRVGASTTDITYEYKPVTVQIPTNAQELPSFQQP